MVCDVVGVATIHIRENDHRQFVINVSRDVGVEALPRTLMFDNAMAVRAFNEPAKSVVP